MRLRGHCIHTVFRGESRLLRLAHWEARRFSLAGRPAWAVILGIAAILAAAGMWWLASRPWELDREAPLTGGIISAWLLGTPLRDPVPSMAQMSFGYLLLRLAAYIVMGIARIALPVMAAGSIADDRKTGRLQDLQLTLLSAREIYLAKALAAALPFLVVGAAAPILLAGVLASESVPGREIARLMLEMEGQVLLDAFVAITCSAILRSRWSATLAACSLLWVVLPGIWIAVLLWTGALPGADRFARSLPPGWGEAGFGTACALQMALTGAVILLAFAAGVHQLRRLGLGAAVAPAPVGG
jgi:hypothetical protein